MEINEEIETYDDADKENKQKVLNYYFQKIEKYFHLKKNVILEYKHISLEEILENAPRYYSLVRLIERINIFITKNKYWLKQVVNKKNISFDWRAYERWKAGKNFLKFRYSATQSPSKWIHVLQDYFIDILEFLQILLVIQFHIKEDDYKSFLKDNPKLKYKIQANYIRPSLPSEDIEKIFEIIDYLLRVNIENSFTTKLIIDTSLCMKVYKKIDKSKVFDLLKQKEFYIKYRLEYLKKTYEQNIILFPYEKDIIKIAEDFLVTLSDLKFTYKEYKTRLIEKYEKIFGKIKK